MTGKPELFEEWRFKPNRGSGRFLIIRIRGDRVTLKDVHGFRRPKNISVRCAAITSAAHDRVGSDNTER